MASDDIGGVWRTIGGRRVFIKDGDSLETAMKKSGKFKNLKLKKSKKEQRPKNELRDKKEEAERKLQKAHDEYSKHSQKSDWNNEEWRKENDELMNKYYDAQKEYEQKFINYTSSIDEKELSWKDKAMLNDLKGAKEREVLEEKRDSAEYMYHRNKWSDDYYGTYREAERKNAELKIENPKEQYEYIRAYAGYKDKAEKTWSGENENKMVSAKMYTNDEFLDHLEDANWHSERRALINAHLTNEQMQYVKEHTKVGLWSSNLDMDKTKKLIQEAKSKYPREGSYKSGTPLARYNNLYNQYKQMHPNSKMTLTKFAKMLENME